MNKFKTIIKNIILIACIIGIIYSSYHIITWFFSVNENNHIQQKNKKSITKVDKTKDDYQVDFKKLKEENPDTVAYLKVNNTNIDYVVVKGKDNNFYLNHNFLKKKNVAGWIFADYRNSFTGNDKNIIIYGHNMKDGSMFDSLKKVITKEWYQNPNNQIIPLITENNTYKYQVFSTYSIKPEDYYITTDFTSDKDYLAFINKLKSRSVYDYQVNLEDTKQILTLSSCLTDGSKRVVLHAKLIEN